MLSGKELSRYARHLSLAEIGKKGQEKLKSSSVLVIGAGGLGCPVLMYLTAAGIGRIGIIDYDKVDETNLQRQVLFNTDDIAKNKAETATEKLRKQNPYVNFDTYSEKLTQDNVLEIAKNYDLIVDGCDNFATRYLVNDACVILDKPFVSGSIFKFQGQISVFNYKEPSGRKGPTYRCLFPEPPSPEEVPDCNEVGVLGVLPGITGTIQANEAIKILIQKGDILSGKLLTFDALAMSFHSFEFEGNPDNYSRTKLEDDYDEVCGVSKEQNASISSEEVTVEELNKMQSDGSSVELLDVREQYETEICSLGGINIPMNQIPENIEKIPRDKPVVVYCHHGMRSEMVVNFLKKEFGYSNLHNLKGGIHAWSQTIDNNMPVY